MDVSIAEPKNRLPELIRAVEDGEKVVIYPPWETRRTTSPRRHPNAAKSGLGGTIAGLRRKWLRTGFPFPLGKPPLRGLQTEPIRPRRYSVSLTG